MTIDSRGSNRERRIGNEAVGLPHSVIEEGGAVRFGFNGLEGMAQPVKYITVIYPSHCPRISITNGNNISLILYLFFDFDFFSLPLTSVSN